MKYTKFLTAADYEKLTLDERAMYIGDMATILKSRMPALYSDPQRSDHKPKKP